MELAEQIKQNKRHVGTWSAGDDAEVLVNLKDFDKHGEYFAKLSDWPNAKYRHELLCHTDINLRRKPSVNMTYGFALKALASAKTGTHRSSRVITKLLLDESIDILRMELEHMGTGEGQLHKRALKYSDLVPRSRIVRNILVDILGAEWPGEGTMYQEVGGVAPMPQMGHHGDRGNYGEGDGR